MENRSHALAAGIFVILLGLAAVFAVWRFGQRADTYDSYLLTTQRNVTGLNIEGTVRYRGIRAGKVESIDQDPKDPRTLLVRINLDSRFRLTDKTTAELGYQGITGLAYVQLEEAGEGGRPLAAQGEEPPRIAIKATLLDTLGEQAGDIASQVGEITARLNSLLDQKNVANFSRTLSNMADASEGLKQAPQVIAGLREALSESNLKRLHHILVHLEKTLGEAAPLTAEMRTMVHSMTALSTRLDHTLGDAGARMTASTLPQIDALVRDLGANSRQLSRLMETLDAQPQALIFGKGAPPPGPGEAGFSAPAPMEK